MGRKRRPSKPEQVAETEIKAPGPEQNFKFNGPRVIPFEVTAPGSTAPARSAARVTGRTEPPSPTVSTGGEEDRREGEVSKEERSSVPERWRFRVSPDPSPTDLSTDAQVRGTRDRGLVLLTHHGGALGYAPGRESAAMLNALERRPGASLRGRVLSVSRGKGLEIELRLAPR
jgi:hypothetical protein